MEKFSLAWRALRRNLHPGVVVGKITES